MTDTAVVPRKSEGSASGRQPLVDDELAGQLVGQAEAEGVELLGPDGLLSQVTKALLERALAEEMTEFPRPRVARRGMTSRGPLRSSRSG